MIVNFEIFFNLFVRHIECQVQTKDSTQTLLENTLINQSLFTYFLQCLLTQETNGLPSAIWKFKMYFFFFFMKLTLRCVDFNFILFTHQFIQYFLRFPVIKEKKLHDTTIQRRKIVYLKNEFKLQKVTVYNIWIK